MERTSSFGYWLRRRRKSLDLTQDELAERVGCALGTIKKLEADERRPSKQLAERLAGVLEISSDQRAAFFKAARADMAADQLEIGQQPAITAPEQPATNLPAHTTPFIGREREVVALRNMICRDDVRLITLSGPGGTGKTRLSLQVAADVGNLFEHGIWFVNLAPVGDPGLVALAIAQALGIHEVSGQPILDLLKRFLREKRGLLLLDNFDQVVDAAPLISDLLNFAPRLKVLVTSRITLHLSGEYELAVPPMALPPAIDHTASAASQSSSGSSIEQYESVRLFVERAQAAKADFVLAAEDAQAIAKICRRLDGLPLAIKLAAARIKLFSPQALLARLDDRLALLTGGPRDLPSRQQTIRDTINWSYNLLSDAEKALFVRLAVFSGGWTIEAAEAVSDPRPGMLAEQILHRSGEEVHIIDELTSLVDKSMVRQVAGPGGEPRFVMLETIREYALERLEQSDDVDRVRRRHAEYYLVLAERWWREAKGYAEVQLFDQLEREHDNLRAALNWSHSSEGDAALELRLAAALHHFFVVRGYVAEAWDRLKAALLRPSAAPDALRAQALDVVGGSIPHYREDLAQAKAFIEEGLALNKRLGNTHGVAWQLLSLGILVGFQGDYGRASELFEQSQSLYQSLDDTWGLSITQFTLGQVAYLQNDLERAEILLQHSLKLCRESIDTTWAAARRLTEIGLVVLARGDPVRARNLFQESLALSRDSQDKVDIPMVLIGLAGVAEAEGQLEWAASMLGAAQALGERFGAYRGLTSEHVQEQISAAIRAQLDAATFEAAWLAGRAQALDDVVEEALRQGT